eukprot:scaffold41591_cov42-Phaeocystis_antarctica.AAC.3
MGGGDAKANTMDALQNAAKRARATVRQWESRLGALWQRALSHRDTPEVEQRGRGRQHEDENPAHRPRSRAGHSCEQQLVRRLTLALDAAAGEPPRVRVRDAAAGEPPRVRVRVSAKRGIVGI